MTRGASLIRATISPVDPTRILDGRNISVNTAKIEALAVSEWQRQQDNQVRSAVVRILDLKSQHLSLTVQRIQIDARLQEIESEISRLKGSK